MVRRSSLFILFWLLLQKIVVASVDNSVSDLQTVFLPQQATCNSKIYRLFATSTNLGIIEINSDTGSILNSFTAPLNQGVSDGLAFDGTNLYYLSGSWDPNTLYALNPTTGAIEGTYNLPSSSFRTALAHLNGLIYILDWSVLTQDITVFDPSSGTVINTLDINGVNPGAPLIYGGLAGITNPDALLVTTTFTNEILELNPTTGLITNRFAHNRNGTLGVATANGQIYLGANTSSIIQIYNRSGGLQGSITVPNSIGIQSLGGDNIASTICRVYLPIVIK